MPLDRMLKDRHFQPDQIRLLDQAFKRALRRLDLVDRNDPLTEIVAKKVIEVGQSGIRDPDEIASTAIRALGLR